MKSLPLTRVCSAKARSVGHTTTPICDTLAVCMSSCTSPCAMTALANAASAPLARCLIAAHRASERDSVAARWQIRCLHRDADHVGEARLRFLDDFVAEVLDAC